MSQFQGNGCDVCSRKRLKPSQQQHQGRKDTLQAYGFGLLFLVLLVITLAPGGS